MKTYTKSATIAAMLAIALAGCSTSTNIRPAHPDTTVLVRDSSNVYKFEGVHDLSLYDSTFGDYPFKALIPGKPPVYGTLPKESKGGNIFLDIVFFAPMVFANAAGPFHYYLIDAMRGIVFFKNDKDADWQQHHITSQESDDARNILAGSQ